MAAMLPALKLNGENPAEAWNQWINSFDIYLTATEVNKKEEKIQVAQLLHFGGADLQKIYGTLQFEGDDKNKLNKVIEKLNDHFRPRKNLTYTRYKFITKRQAEGTTLQQFVTELRKEANNCEFGDLREDLIKLMLICGTNNSEIRHRLLQEDEGDLEKYVRLASLIEESKTQARIIAEKKESIRLSRQ